MLSKEHFRDLSGRKVVARDGSSLGEVDQLYADRDGGQPTFITVRTSSGAQTYFAPLDGARMDGEVVMLAHDAKAVQSAPGVSSGGELSEEEESRLYKHYGMKTPAGDTTVDERIEADLGHPAGMAGAENPALPTDHPIGMAGTEGAPSWPAHHEPGMAGQATDPYPEEHPAGMAGQVKLAPYRLRRWTPETTGTGAKSTTGTATTRRTS